MDKDCLFRRLGRNKALRRTLNRNIRMPPGHSNFTEAESPFPMLHLVILPSERVANAYIPAHSRLLRQHCCVLSTASPMMRPSRRFCTTMALARGTSSRRIEARFCSEFPCRGLQRRKMVRLGKVVDPLWTSNQNACGQHHLPALDHAMEIRATGNSRLPNHFFSHLTWGNGSYSCATPRSCRFWMRGH